MNVVICAAREREDSDEDKRTVLDLLKSLVEQYGGNLYVLSVGCDRGIGKVVRDYCMAHNVYFMEFRIKFEGENFKRAVFVQVFKARNLSLADAGDEFYIFKGPNENGIIEALIPVAIERVKAARVHVWENPV